MTPRTQPYERLGLITLVFGAILSVALNSTGLGVAILLIVIGYAALSDWAGVKTLHGLVSWQNRPKWQAVLFIIMYPLLMYVYIFRIAFYHPNTRELWNWAQVSWRNAGIVFAGALSIILILAFIASFNTIGAVATTGSLTTQALTVKQAPATAPTIIPSQNGTIATPAVTATALPPKPTATAIPATSTSIPPTAKPLPTAIPTQVPAPAPKTPPAPPTPVPAPTTPPVATGINGNPWGYNFTQGNLIYSPPSEICNYFSCIGNFWNGRGYVIECTDQTFSKSGGIRGSCSHHGGNLRELLQP